MIIVYLMAIVVANLLAVRFGPGITIFNAFIFIGLDITVRDYLHVKWSGNPFKMGALILTGGAAAAIINQAALPIAIASSVAFILAGVVDYIVFSILKNKPHLVRVNVSNIFSSATDSIVFPTLAFGGFLPVVVLGQFLAKVFGGAIWAFVIQRVRNG